jgi:hypothetical protein
MSKKMMSMLLTLLFTGLGEFGTVPLGGLLLCVRVIITNPALITSDNPGQEGCIVAIPLLDPSRNHSPDTRLKIKKGYTKSACLPNCMQFCTLTPEIC